MRVHLIRKETIEDFSRNNTGSRASLKDWLSKLNYADWLAPEDIQSTFNSADLLGQGTDRVVFDIGGNNYRIICKYYFGTSKVHIYIKWIGTHAAYSKLCRKGAQYIVDEY